MRCQHCLLEISSINRMYCSNQCQADYRYSSYIEEWKKGNKSGVRGIDAQGISRHLRRYLLEKYKACTICEWKEVNPVTGMVPLEVDHIDGDSLNNSEDNLRLLCPNCHSLTANYRNLNRGHGRAWRRNKYIKNPK